MNEWFEWKGGECPVPDDVKFAIRLRNGSGDVWDGAFDLDWVHRAEDANQDIIAYRIIKESEA